MPGDIMIIRKNKVNILTTKKKQDKYSTNATPCITSYKHQYYSSKAGKNA